MVDFGSKERVVGAWIGSRHMDLAVGIGSG